MRIKPFSNFKSVVYWIFIFGIVLDTYGVYMFWSQLNDDQQIKELFEMNGLSMGESDLSLILDPIQNIFSIVLVSFLIWDYVAYYYFLKHREWARKYVLSIAIFYVLSCFWEISFVQGLFGLATLYYLWGTRSEFLPKEN